MKKNFVLFMQIALLTCFFLDMVGLRFGDNILVAMSYNEDGISFVIYVATVIIFAE